MCGENKNRRHLKRKKITNRTELNERTEEMYQLDRFKCTLSFRQKIVIPNCLNASLALTDLHILRASFLARNMTMHLLIDLITIHKRKSQMKEIIVIMKG